MAGGGNGRWVVEVMTGPSWWKRAMGFFSWAAALFLGWPGVAVAKRGGGPRVLTAAEKRLKGGEIGWGGGLKNLGGPLLGPWGPLKLFF